jgi:PAS domain S-box-containing protein
MGRTLDRGLLVGIGLLVALLILNAGLAYYNTRQLRDDVDSVVHTHEVLNLTGDVLLALVDAETGERGFLLTGREEFLQPYRDALARLDERLARLKDRTRDNQRQQVHIRELEEMIAARLALLRQAIDLRRKGEKEAQSFTAKRGKDRMDAIRALVARMEQDEHYLLRVRQRQSERAYRIAVTTGLFTGFLGLAFVGAFVWLLNRSLGARQQAAAVLHEQREWFRTTLASIGDAVIATDLQGRVVLLNPVAQALTGWPQAEAEGQPLETVFRIVNEYTRQPVENPVAKALRQGTVVGLANHSTLIAKDGTERPIDDSAAPIKDEQGHIAGVILVFRDVTERRRADEARRRLAAIVASSEDAIVGKDLDGVITDWNAAAERVYGYPAAEVVGKPFSVLVPAERSSEVQDSVVRLRRGDRLDHFETVRRRKDGRLIDVSVSYSPIKDEEGRLVGTAVITRDITERKRAEKALREVEARFAAIVNHAPVCIFAKDRQGRYLLANRALADLLGRAPEDILGRTDDDFFPPAVSEQFRREDGAVLATGLPGTYEKTFPVGGAAVTALVVKFPLLDAEGNAYATCGIATDVTEQKQAERALRESEERLRLALEAGRMGVWDWNVQTGVVKWSDNLEPIHGLAPGTFAGTFEAFEQLVHPDDRQAVNRAVRRALEEGSGYDLEFRNVWPDGSVHWMAGKGQVYGAGRPERMVGVALDITERKRAEQDTRFLADASATLASLVDYGSTLQKVARLAVPAFADWCAVDMLEGDGSLRRLAVAHVDPPKVELAHELHRRFPPDPSAPQGVWNIIRTGRPELFPDIADELLVRSVPDAGLLGILRELGLRSYLGVPLAVRGRVLGVLTFIAAESGRRYDTTDLAVAEDLAHRAAVAIENARLYQEVRVADRRKDEFLAMLAHELRNPLAPIRNALYILKLPGASETVAERARALMERQVEHMVRLVDDLLDVSRIMRGKIELRREPVELATVVARAVETSQPVFEAEGHELTVTVAPEPLPLDGDLVRLAQVVSNLLNNAAKYTERGGKVWLTGGREGDQAVVRVRDTGVGIALDMLPVIFDMFVQADRRTKNSQGGMGIGLTLVRRLVELHGGSVEAHSAGLGQGSEFVVRLPLTHRTGDANGREEPAGQSPAGEAAPRRVLVVDDNVDAADSLALLLRMEGHAVTVAHDGLTALTQAAADPPELALLDIGMPKMDGYELARRFRADPALRDVVLVALTGWGQDEDRRRTREAGFDHHLVKPVEPEALHGLLRRPG